MTALSTASDGLRREIEARGPWFHNLHLPGGVQTAPDHRFGDFPSFKWQSVAAYLPEDLTGKRVLDIGCNAGFYCFALAERGAEVVGIDSDRRYLAQARWAAEVLGETRVRFEEAQVYDLPTLGGRFDLVLFMGVFYHLRHPLLALDLLAELAPETLLFQTLTFGDEQVSRQAREDFDFDARGRLGSPGWPQMAFIEGRFANDPTNWWVPNHAAVEAMLRNCGFRVDARPGHEIYLCSFSGGGRQTSTATGPAVAARRLQGSSGKEQG